MGRTGENGRAQSVSLFTQVAGVVRNTFSCTATEMPYHDSIRMWLEQHHRMISCDRAGKDDSMPAIRTTKRKGFRRTSCPSPTSFDAHNQNYACVITPITILNLPSTLPPRLSGLNKNTQPGRMHTFVTKSYRNSGSELRHSLTTYAH